MVSSLSSPIEKAVKEKRRLSHHAVLIMIILGVALSLRLIGINWDANQHLHPDERFLTMVVQAMQKPSSPSEYFSITSSLLNPYNLGYTYYVYGGFPLIILRYFSETIHMFDYNGITLSGRFLSACFDSLTVLLLYWIVFQLLQLVSAPKREILHLLPFFSALTYALSVQAIQLSHFFATDTFTLAFIMLALAISLRLITRNSNIHENISVARLLILIGASGLLYGFAISSKISALYCAPLVMLPIAFYFLTKYPFGKAITLSLLCIGYFSLIAYLATRVAYPYYFASINIFDPTPHPQFIRSLSELQRLYEPDSLFPPNIQWIDRSPILFPLQNIVLWALGIPFTLYLLIGTSLLTKNAISFMRKYHWRDFVKPKDKSVVLVLFGIITLFWVIGLFLYLSLTFIQTLRYYIVLMPFLSVGIAYGVLKIIMLVSSVNGRLFRLAGFVAVSLLFIIWPLSFVQIYGMPHTRIQASYWIRDNISAESKIAFEHWDDPLPLQIPGIPEKKYEFVELPVFVPDSEQKMQEVEMKLNSSDYYILSSNRAWASIMRLPEIYPLQTKLYKDLFDGKTNFQLVKMISPKIHVCFVVCIPIDTQSAEESFTVYDHPQIFIFKRIR